MKSSLAPGSKVVTEYYERAGLTPYLEALGFHTVGYGCTTCIGNSGPLPEAISAAIAEGDLVACAVLSGNRNFEARIHPEVKANYLASPPLVVAYALAGRMDVDLATEPLGHDRGRRQRLPRRHLAVGRRGAGHDRVGDRRGHVPIDVRDVFTGEPAWRELPVPEGELFAWDPDSTYVRQPPYFDGMTPEPGTVDDIVGRALPRLGRRLGHDRPHLPGGLDQARSPGRARTSSSTASSGETSTPTARGAATTR